jgi:hypothetical protein
MNIESLKTISERNSPVITVQTNLAEISLHNTLTALGKLAPQAQRLFATHLFSQDFRQELGILLPTYRRQHTPQALDGFRSEVNGDLLEGTGAIYLEEAILNSAERLIRKPTVDHIFRKLEVQRPIVDGVTSTPDLIVLTPQADTTFISGLAEITAASLPMGFNHQQNESRLKGGQPKKDRKERQYERYVKGTIVKDLFTDQSDFWKTYLGEYFHMNFPHLPSRLDFSSNFYRVFYVFPSGVSFLPPVHENRALVNPVPLPFTRDDLTMVSNAVIEDLSQAA